MSTGLLRPPLKLGLDDDGASLVGGRALMPTIADTIDVRERANVGHPPHGQVFR